LVSKILNY